MIERYTRPEMGKIWTPENRYQAWLRVELAVCEAWNRVGEISDADMETLRKEADFTVDRAFVDRANEIEETTRHDVIAFLTAIEEKVGPVSRFIHLGCTSSDIVDTAGSLLMVEAGELILKAFDRVLAVLKKMTLEHQGPWGRTPCFRRKWNPSCATCSASRWMKCPRRSSSATATPPISRRWP